MLCQLLALLEDTDVEVRTIGVKGVSRVLGVYWELLPPATTRNLLNKLVTELAFDASSTEVRVMNSSTPSIVFL